MDGPAVAKPVESVYQSPPDIVQLAKDALTVEQ
jgi:hypothetical protein